MSVFKIRDYRRASGNDTVEFEVEFRDGELAAGDTFYCYDTHHPVPYTVRALQRDGRNATLKCDGEFCYDDAFVDGVVDTTQKGRPAGFHYEGPTPLLFDFRRRCPSR